MDELEPGRRRRRAKAGSFTDDQKREAVIALASRKASAQEVADAVGVTRAVLYKWKNQLLGEEAPCSKMEAAPKNTTDDVDALRSQAAELQKQIKRLELRKAILEGTVKLLGKGQGVDPGMLTNRKKALLANSLRPARKLNEILSELGMSRSSYQYQIEAMSRPDKHVGLRRRISEIFAASDGRYGYRRIRLGLRSEGVRVSEKVVARLMRELDLVAKRGKKRRYSSYKGEISDAPENLVKRNFHADAPTRCGSPTSPSSGYPPARSISAPSWTASTEWSSAGPCRPRRTRSSRTPCSMQPPRRCRRASTRSGTLTADAITVGRAGSRGARSTASRGRCRRRAAPRTIAPARASSGA